MRSTFSKSPVWQLQRQYFEESGVNAWRDGDVPHYITSNPRMAGAYAQLLLAFFSDRQAAGSGDEPIYVIELGAGSGRFSYHLIKAVNRLLEGVSFSTYPFIFVMADFAASNLQFWDSHLRLQEFFEQGILDYAVFDAEKDTEIRLISSGRTIGHQSAGQPIAVIANYFFDSIPQDLFYFDKGQTKTVLVELEGYDPKSKKTAKEQLEKIKDEYNYADLNEIPYQNTIQSRLFQDYQNELVNSHLLFPATGLNCIENIKQLSREGLLLITADKAIHRLEDWHDRPAPYLVKHGSFSLTANYHAIKQHCLLSGGRALLPHHPESSIVVAAFLYLDETAHYKATAAGYNSYINDFGPDEFFSIKGYIEQHTPTLSTRELFAFLRFSGYDAQLFLLFLPRLHELSHVITTDERFTILQLAGRVWDEYYPLGEKNDLAYRIGMLLFNLHFFKEAISFFELSERIYTETENVMFAKAAAYAALDDKVSVKEYLIKILERYPDNKPAQTLLDELSQ